MRIRYQYDSKNLAKINIHRNVYKQFAKILICYFVCFNFFNKQTWLTNKNDVKDKKSCLL